MVFQSLQIICFYLLCVVVVHGLSTSLAAANKAGSTSSPLPRRYRALVAESTGESFSEVAVVRELPIPSLGETEVLIRVSYAGVNGGCETFRARGEHAFLSNRDAQEFFRLGSEGVGTVAAVGPGVRTFAAGDPVVFMGSAFSEYAVCDEKTITAVPEATPEYVGLRISGVTACAMLEVTGKVAPGETVLITAAAGGAGHFAVQFAKLAGCTVIGTCSSTEKAAVLADLGCDHVINYRTQNVADELKRLAPDGLDAVLEGVGGRMLQVALDALAPEGRLMQIGYIAEYPHNPRAAEESKQNELTAASLFWKSETIHRGKQIIYGNAWPKDVQAVYGSKDRVFELFKQGKIKSLVDKAAEFSGLESVSAAVDHMLSGKTIGKVVVKID